MGGSDVVAVDLEQVQQGGEEVLGADLGPGDVLPGGQREFLDDVFGLRGVPAAAQVQVAGEQLDVEYPLGAEAVGEDLFEIGGDAEELGAALGVVDAESQKQGDDGVEPASEVEACPVALDAVPEQFDARADDHLELGAVGEDAAEGGDHVQGCGQVGVPEADEPRAVVDGTPEAESDGLGLAAVGGEVHDVDGHRMLVAQGI